VASQYYGVLQSRDTAHNNYLGLKSFEKSLERERAFQQEGLKTAADVARLEDTKLQRDLQWTNTVRNYLQNLDNFKILLGLPTDTALALDEGELTRLLEQGVKIPAVTTEEAVKVALATRLDLYTQRDLLEDAQRRIKVAANALKPGLDLVLSGNVNSKSGDRFASLDFSRSTWTAGAALDLPLDRKSERNGFRRSLIDYEVAIRNTSLVEDNVKLDVRNSYRNLLNAKKDYDISTHSLELNQNRVDEVTLRADLGIGNILDQVDAQNALTAAKSAVTSAIVSYHISMLQFWRDLGILYVKENGTWEEMKDV
jgi:outer membrane protein TolC